MRRDEEGGRAIMFRSEGEDECSHRMQPPSLLNLTQRRGEKTTKARGQTDENQGSRDGFSTREGGRHGQGDGIITGWKSKRY